LEETWEFLSDESVDFIKSLLVVDPAQRPTVQEAQKHAWFEQEFKLQERAPGDKMVLSQVRSELQLATQMTRFHKIILETVAHRLSRSELLELRKTFDMIDTSNSGTVSFGEFKSVMREVNLPEEDIAGIFDGVGIEEDGSKMSYIEFLGATLEFHTTIHESALVEAFHRLDTDDSGYVTIENIKSVFPTSTGDAEDILKEMGVEDGKISCEEFLAAFRKESDKLKAVAMDPVRVGKLSSKATKS
jgi:calcium-dependent protein kinase